MTRRKRFALVVWMYAATIWVGIVQAMTSTNYTINWDSLNSGGEDTSTSTNYKIRDTVGEQATGYVTSSNYKISGGYRAGDTDLPVLSFSVGTQENATQVTYSAFSNAGKTVEVSSTSSFSVGNLIGVVENEGLLQIVAIGEITAIAGATMTVDAWDGDPASLSASPSGGNDYVYRMEGNAADFGTLNLTSSKTSMSGTRVTSNAENGYSVYVHDDDNLRVSASQYIFNVADGTVSAGSEEYGWRVYGTTATSTGYDYAFTTSTQDIQTSSVTAAAEDRIALIYKLSVVSGTPAGNYSHLVYYTLTANY